jgi:hypothetical protein
MNHPAIYVTDEELAFICSPLVQPTARQNFLNGLGMKTARRPNGQILLARSEFERVLGAPTAPEPPKKKANLDFLRYAK